MRNKALVIHYLGDGLSPYEKPLKKRWLSESGRPAYDYGIDSDGSVVVGRSLNVRGAHAIATKLPYLNWPTKKYSDKWGWYSEWFNLNAIGVVVCQGLLDPLPNVMYQGLVGLLKDLVKEHDIPPEKIFYHSDILPTACPGWLKGRKAQLLIDINKDFLVKEDEEMQYDRGKYKSGNWIIDLGTRKPVFKELKDTSTIFHNPKGNFRRFSNGLSVHGYEDGKNSWITVFGVANDIIWTSPKASNFSITGVMGADIQGDILVIPYIYTSI